jgi:hypothetical protein
VIFIVSGATQYRRPSRLNEPRNPRGKAAKPSACPSAPSSKIWIDRCLPGNVLLSRLLLLSFIELGFDTEALHTHKASAHADPDQIV